MEAVVHRRTGNRFRLGIVNFVLRGVRLIADVLPIRRLTMNVVDAVLALPILLLARRAAVDTHQIGSCIRADVVVHPSVRSPERTILHVHGGGFVFGSTRTHRLLAAQMSKACRARVVLFDYRRMPQFSIESSIDDCVAAYNWTERTYRDEPVVLSGDSAGGNLMLSVLSRVDSTGGRMPAAVVGISAWLDPDYVHLKGAPRDSFFALHFARRAAALAHPRSSILPLNGQIPTVPVLLQCGAEEPLRTSNEALAEMLVRQGTRVELQVWEGQPHVFQMFAPLAPEAVAALNAIGAFLADVDVQVR